ncbi:MAG: GHKL domain-containing protein [Clostridia bacterium]|nr:GHKL domain-containing protein [Clostridia bacterium]
MEWYISNGLIFMYLALFICFNMKSKINKIATFLIVFLPYTVFGLTQKVMMPIMSPIIHVAITWVIFFVSVWFIFEESPKTKIFNILVLVVIVYATGLIAPIIGLIFNDDVQEFNLPATIIYHLLTIILFGFFTIVRQKISISKYNLTVFIVIGITQLLFAEVSVLFMTYGGNPLSPNPPSLQSGGSNSFALVVIGVASLFYMVSDVVLFVMMRKLSQSEKIKEELRFREYKNQINLDYYKSIEKNAEETRKLRHDMANILQVAAHLFEGNEKDKETSEQMFSQIEKEISEIHLEKYTDNSLVNAIISNKAAFCRENGVDYSFDIRIPNEINIEEIDICKAYVNIIDNAINAVLFLSNEKRKIEIKSFVDNGTFFISSKNCCISKERKSKKSNSEEHGFGQKILSDIAEKYDGKFVTEQTDNLYTALLAIRV